MPSPDALPQPGGVAASLREGLRARGQAPGRAIRRIAAASGSTHEARMLRLAEGAACGVGGTGHPPSGRSAGVARGLCRPDAHDVVAEPGLGA